MPETQVIDSFMFHEEVGDGPTFLFLHGNPTSSYAWRNVIPAVGEEVRAVAPDLIGMGRSGKPNSEYRFDDHARYLAAWMEQVVPGELVLVGHDWGGALAMDWAARHPDRVRGLVLMETILRPFTWEDFPPSHRARYEALRSSAGETKVLDQNFFIEHALLATTRHGLSPRDHEVYRSPYLTRESRRPLLAWPREMPIEGHPADTVGRIRNYDTWLATSPEVPKLLLTFEGDDQTLMIGPKMDAWARANIAALEVECCGPAGHLCLEDQPSAIGRAIRTWAMAGVTAGNRS